MPQVNKRYVRIFLIFLSINLALIFLIALYIQPLEGELTRLGSYAERDFGWNASQKKIRGDANLVTAYDGKTEVLIIGDSFSYNGVWQPFFKKNTGLSYETLNIRKMSIPEFLKSKQFREYPPKIIILQCVERELVYFFRDINISCDRKTGSAISIPMRKYAADPSSEYYEETRKTFDLRNINLKYAASVGIHSLIRSMTGTDTRNTKKFVLTNNSLFTNLKNGEILVYEGDMNKLSWSKGDIEKAVYAISCVQNRVQSTGKTLFVFMLVPDKSTAYADYISTPVFRNRENVWKYLTSYGINVPRIDILLKAAIDRGEKDIYCPSGTHWSARGYELAAERIAGFIKERSVVLP
jgi:hypothetical protein